MHTPLGIAYFRALEHEGDGVRRDDMAKGPAYMVAFALVGIVGPNVVLYDKNSP